MYKSVTVGPFSMFFTNVNKEMNLPGHSHFATLTLEYQTLGAHGFPAFAETYAAIQQRIQVLTALPFRDATNEVVADRLFADFATFTDPCIERWMGHFQLVRLTLSVRGVPDRIGHADGFTDYTVRTREE
jgi:hypothetical protein